MSKISIIKIVQIKHHLVVFLLDGADLVLDHLARTDILPVRLLLHDSVENCQLVLRGTLGRINGLLDRADEEGDRHARQTFASGFGKPS